MQIFLVEHLTSGAVPDEETPLAALATEGAAMLRVLAADAVKVPGWSVAVLWAKSLGPFGVPGVEVLSPTSLDDEARLFIEHVSRADRTLVIAPESVSTTLQSGSRAIASRISNASPSWRPANAVPDIARNRSVNVRTFSSDRLSSGTSPSLRPS